MNCEQWQRKLLLAESGELPDGERQSLDAHLADCPVCRDFRDASLTLASAVRPVLRQGEPAAATMAAINEEVASSARGPRLLVFRPITVRVAACAAALALIVGGWFLLRSETESAPDTIHQVGSLLTMISEQHAGDSGVPAVPADNNIRLRALARELLRMEGLALDEVL
jgi:anti-sigma factor RsiW